MKNPPITIGRSGAVEDGNGRLIVPADFVAAAGLQSHNRSLGAFGHVIFFGPKLDLN